MRRKDREITDLAEVQDIVCRCRVMHVGLVDGGMPYIVPMNFGALWDGEQLTLYAHSATAGRKMELIRQAPPVFIQMDCDGELVTGTSACTYGYRYKSLMGLGRAEEVTDPDEMRSGMVALMRQQTGRDFTFSQEELTSVAVLRITLTEWSAKACR